MTRSSVLIATDRAAADSRLKQQSAGRLAGAAFGDVQAWFDQLPAAAYMSHRVRRAVREGIRDLENYHETGSRYEIMVRVTNRLVHLAQSGSAARLRLWTTSSTPTSRWFPTRGTVTRRAS
jgi:hypothetical protein